MKVKELIKILKTLDQNAEIDMSSDEEGNNFGDISEGMSKSVLKSNGKKVYSLYPENQQLPEERFEFEDSGGGDIHD